jgi:hypothetical protein
MICLATFFFVSQGRDNISERVETFVDAYTFLHELAGGPCFFNSLRSCKIHKMKLCTDIFFTSRGLRAILLN